jgi:class 3 adenylate cyclase
LPMRAADSEARNACQFALAGAGRERDGSGCARDLIGAGAAQERTVVGETPNLAARLQSLAEPGAVVIAASTRRLTGGLFEYRDLGTLALKGFVVP